MSTPRTVLVTGGNRGIGRAIAEEFIRQGHRVAVTVRSGEGPTGALSVVADVTDSASLDAAFAEVAEKLFRRATGYSHEAVKIVADAKTKEQHIVPYVEHYPPDTTACIFWLKNRRPEAWRDMRISSMTDLILMKIFRTKQIENNDGKTLVSEGVEANYQDMLNYAVFCLITLKGEQQQQQQQQ